MEGLFLNIANMSLTAAYCAVIVLCIRFCIRRLPKVYSYVLWGAVFFRLAMPFSFESIYSLVRMNSRPIPVDIGIQQTPQIITGFGSIDYIANRALSMVLPQTDAAASVNPMQVLIFCMAWVWLVVAAGLLCYGILSYGILGHRLKDAVRFGGQIYMTDKIPAPFVMGAVTPRIYLPSKLSAHEREYVVRHEQVHIKRHDYLIKQLAFIIVCIHWFNPMAWVSLYLMCRDMEMSCDEQVLKSLQLEGREALLYKKEYSAALLSVASGRQIAFSGPLFFGEGNVKGRIQNVLGYKKPAKIVTCLSVVFIALAAVGLMGNKKPDASYAASDSTPAVWGAEDADYKYICFLPKACWAGIEGLGEGEEAYPIILTASDVYDDFNGNMAAIYARLYCQVGDNVVKVAEISSSGTAYPLSFGQSGIYVDSGHTGNRCMINVETWELEIVERVEAVYDENGGERYYYEADGEVRGSTEEEFLAFFTERGDVTVMNFEEGGFFDSIQGNAIKSITPQQAARY